MMDEDDTILAVMQDGEVILAIDVDPDAREGTIGNDVIESTDVGGNSPHPMAIALLACVM